MSIAPKRSNSVLGQFYMLYVRLCDCVSGIFWWLHFDIAISIVRKAYPFFWIIFMFQLDDSEDLQFCFQICKLNLCWNL